MTINTNYMYICIYLYNMCIYIYIYIYKQLELYIMIYIVYTHHIPIRGIYHCPTYPSYMIYQQCTYICKCSTYALEGDYDRYDTIHDGYMMEIF